MFDEAAAILTRASDKFLAMVTQFDKLPERSNEIQAEKHACDALRPVDGFCAEGRAAATLALTVFGGVPVSTTRTITGAIVGVGSLKRLSAVRWGVAGRVVWAWVLTIPRTAQVVAVCWWLLPRLG
jgi:phosphate/sulfate permease